MTTLKYVKYHTKLLHDSCMYKNQRRDVAYDSWDPILVNIHVLRFTLFQSTVLMVRLCLYATEAKLQVLNKK